MVGYPESLTDPSYHAQIVVLTYPLIGNYGVPEKIIDKHGLPTKFESSQIWAAGLVVGEYCEVPSHWQSVKTLSQWMKDENIPGISGIDTRELTKKIREKGTILGKIIFGNLPANLSKHQILFKNPNIENLVEQVSIKKPVVYNKEGSPKICVVDCGIKYNQIRCFIERGACVTLVPWNHKLNIEDYDGLFISNGPGDPEMCSETIGNVKKVLESGVVKPIFGICLGHQLLSTAIGCDTFKMK